MTFSISRLKLDNMVNDLEEMSIQRHDSERRRYRRLVSEFDVDIVIVSGEKAGDQITGKIINISMGGAGAEMRSKIPIGTQVALTIYSDEDQSVCSGEIIWTSEVEGRMIHGIKISQWSYLDPSIENQLSGS